ncbi:MAG: hypothetical protein ACRDRJ_47790, partial [Streptosporangiaceae bacterium]
VMPSPAGATRDATLSKTRRRDPAVGRLGQDLRGAASGGVRFDASRAALDVFLLTPGASPEQRRHRPPGQPAPAD